jgi:Heterokaryon incompatibility protein (HET)
MARLLNRIITSSRQREADAYKYSPLDEKASHIRLLALLPGEFSAKVHIRLHTKQLRTDKCPKYEALSYVWGSTEDPVDIFVGSSTQYSLAVTQNLARALPYLRYRDRERVLWIDAICVNQKDLRERSQQVKRMATIYSMAQRVIVWLGEEENNSTLALQTLDGLSTKIEVSYLGRTMKPASRDASGSHCADLGTVLPFSERAWSSINDLLHRAWFERLWIWQEICLANRDAIIHCGITTILWKAFRSAIFSIQVKSGPRLDDFRTRRIHVFRLCDSYARQSTLPFSKLAEMTRHYKCSDPRDRVYALLSIVDIGETEVGSIKPDYTKSFHDIYKDLLKHEVEDLKTLRLLQHCGLRESIEDTLTWVLDWSSPLITDLLSYVRSALQH